MASMLRVTNEETLRAVLEDWGRNFDEANAPEECGEVPDAVLPRAVEAAIASLRSGNENERENACAALKAFDAEIARDRWQGDIGDRTIQHQQGRTEADGNNGPPAARLRQAGMFVRHPARGGTRMDMPLLVHRP